MAYFKAFTAFDIGTLNLSKLITNQTDSAFYDNINDITGDSNEQDIAAFQYSDGITKTVYFGGAGFKFATDGSVTGGTVRALSLFSGAISDFSKPDYILNRLTVSALDIYAAAKTVSTADDLALLTKALSGDDRFLLSEGNDILNGFAGNDEIFGFGGNDILTGGAGNDVISGGNGDDILFGGTGNDVLKGGAGNDRAGYIAATSAVTVDLRILTAQNTGGAGSDTLSSIESVGGSKFNDTIDGNKAGNVLIGGEGNDKLDGHEGADGLVGGAGQDTLTGGTGADNFLFFTPTDASGSIVDTITDFSHAQGDHIVLSKGGFTGLTGAAGTVLAADAFFASANATAAQDASDRLIYNTTTGALWYDADGTGSAAAVQIALIGTATHPALVAGDFLIIA
ncbi:MAG: calcium-binding protein [Novosphingobium sp.]